MKFRGARGTQVVRLHPHTWGHTKKTSKYREVLGPWLKSSVPIAPPERAYKLTLDRLGPFDICLVVAKTISNTQAKVYGHHGTAAIDPGVRSPFIVYDPDGGVIDIGSGDMASKVFNELYAADRLRPRVSRGTDVVGKHSRSKRRRRRKARSVRVDPTSSCRPALVERWARNSSARALGPPAT